MSYLRLVLVSLLALALAGCATTATPTTETTAQAQAPTSPIGAGGLPTMGQIPTSGVAQPTSAALTTYTVQRGPIEDVLTLQGQISPRQFVLSFTQDGVVTQVYAQPGQTIAPGDLIAELDLGDLPSQLSEAELTVNQNQASVNRTVQAAQLEVRQAQSDLEVEQAKLDELSSPPTALELAEAQAEVSSAQSSLETVRNDASQTKNLARVEMEGAVKNLQQLQATYSDVVNRLKKADGEDAVTLLEQKQDLETQMREAEDTVNRSVIEYDTARNNEVSAIQEAESQLRLAQARLDDLRNNRVDKVTLLEQQQAVKNAQIAVDQARQNAAPDPDQVRELEASKLLVTQLQKDIAARRLYATVAGEVISAVTPGTPVDIGSQVATLIDRSQIEILVGSEQLGATVSDELGVTTTQSQLSIGQSVAIAFGRYPGQAFSGKIMQLPSGADALTVDSYYHVTFDLLSRSFDIGDMAELTIIRSRKDNALWLPPAAVSNDGVTSYVLVEDGAEGTRVDVILGIVTTDKVEILSGLEEGDVVIGA